MTRDREAGNTTLPQSATRPNGADQKILGLRWAFPLPNSLVTSERPERLLLGRTADCDVVLPGAEISRQHAELLRRGPLWVVRDLGSRNGVYLNGQRVEAEALTPGDVLRVGEWIGVVRELSCAAVDGELPFGELTPGVFGSTALARVLNSVAKAAPSDLRIVVQGETGTGKECVAQAIHAWSGRTGGFVAVNCAALPEALAEAELFGYRKGAFTGAARASVGHLRAAHGGTLLLDEITDLPLNVQAKLLRALEQRAVVPLGESMPIPVDVRIIAAAQEPLRRAVEQNRFRTDLWARLDGLTITLPPLRERSEDVPGLFARMLSLRTGGQPHSVDARCIEQLCLYDWPGNVREVAQLARQLAVLQSRELVLRRSYLPERMLGEKRRQPLQVQGREPLVSTTTVAGPLVSRDAAWVADDVELRREEDLKALVQALRLHQGNMALAARELGISRQKAYRRLGALPDHALDEFRELRRQRAVRGNECQSR